MEEKLSTDKIKISRTDLLKTLHMCIHNALQPLKDVEIKGLDVIKSDGVALSFH